jgi:GT2 family glycosyltransferase
MTSLSIIIPCYNRWKFTAHTLDSLLLLDKKYDIEIIVSDDGSSDETSEAIKYYFTNDQVKYVRNDVNEGFAKATGKAYTISKGEVVLFLNNDIKIKDKFNNWVDVLFDAADNNPNALMGPLGGFVDPKNNFIFCYETGDNDRKINYISGFCIFAKRNLFDKLILDNSQGPFDEEFKFYFEDGDLSFRNIALGNQLKLIQLPIQHIGKVSSNQLNIYKLYNAGRQIFLKKWKNKVKE